MSAKGSETEWRAEIETRLGVGVREIRPVAGGDIAESYRVELGASERLFLKDYAGGPIGIGASEAAGLAWLREAGALRVPEVLAFGPTWLALEWIESSVPRPDFAEQLGEGLAALHRLGSLDFGHPEDNWVGRIPQQNAPRESWARFYGDCRIEPLRQQATLDDTLPDRTGRLLDRLVEALPDLVGPPEPAARLHGDLWSGNLMVDETGSPCLIDPAVYGGHREIDLAMMRLFGGFERAVFECYAEAYPLAPGAASRLPLYQVYPLLVHVCLFGKSYVGRLEEALRSALESRT